MLRENYVINTQEVLSVVLDGVMLLGNVNHSLNNLRKEKFRPTLSRDLQHLCDSSNLVTSFRLGDYLTRRIKEAKETTRITLSHKPQRLHNNSGYNNQNAYCGSQSKQFQNSSSFSSKQHYLLQARSTKVETNSNNTEASETKTDYGE